MKWLYLLVDLFTVIVPLIFSFHPKLNFYKSWKAFFLANIFVSLIFIAWDILFTRLGVWGFNPDYVLGAYFFNLPVEEVLFFICIPFSCVFTYHCFNLFWGINWKSKSQNLFVVLMSLLLFITGIYYLNKLYTAGTFISLACVLMLITFFANKKGLSKLTLVYPLLVIPFFIVNGILTGTGLQHPVVWYNNSHNLGIRLLTIPVEDLFYGFELVLANVVLYEFFKNKLQTDKLKVRLKPDEIISKQKSHRYR
ncbi:MAG: lycopene cyclase domain-containing protein [Ginsengibacter sp.]